MKYRPSLLTVVFLSIIVAQMQKYRLIFLCTIIACLLAACNLLGNDVQIVPIGTEDASVQVTLLPTPTQLPTVPPPTPTPVSRANLGDQPFFHGDWDAALKEYQTALETRPDPEV